MWLTKRKQLSRKFEWKIQLRSALYLCYDIMYILSEYQPCNCVHVVFSVRFLMFLDTQNQNKFHCIRGGTIKPTTVLILCLFVTTIRVSNIPPWSHHHSHRDHLYSRWTFCFIKRDHSSSRLGRLIDSNSGRTHGLGPIELDEVRTWPLHLRWITIFLDNTELTFCYNLRDYTSVNLPKHYSSLM